MAKKRIDKNTFVDGNPFERLETGAKEAEASIKSLELASKSLVETAKQTKKQMTTANTREAKSVKELEQLTRTANQTAQNKLKIDKQLNQEKIRLQELNKQRNQQARQVIRLQQAEAGSVEALRAKLALVTKAWTKLTAEELKNTKRGQRLVRSKKQLTEQLKRLEKETGDNRREVGNYSKALGGLRGNLMKIGSAFGAAFAGFALVRDAFNTVKDFGQAQADLASVLGTTTDGMAALTNQAKELGATTRFTASEVSELQKEFAKLGFTQQEIQNVTDSTLSLAAATGTDLARAAEVTGSTLRAFGLDSSETQRVVDVMAKSFSSSSLDMEKFSTAMASVAPIAKTVGLNVERTTALLGTLTDRGIDASTAGTGLRNIFLQLSKKGLTFEEAMQKINTATDKNKEAVTLFGARSATLGVILSETGTDVDSLTTKLEGASDGIGAAAEMANTQLNTLGGSLDLLRSAWEGYILKLNDASGAGGQLQKGLKFLAENLEEILDLLVSIGKVWLVYKARLIAVNIAQKAFGTGTGRMNFSLKQLRTNLRDNEKGLGNLKNALANVGWAAVIALVVKFVNALREAALGIQSVRRQAALVNGEITKATDSTQEWLDNLQKITDERVKAAQGDKKLIQDALDLQQKLVKEKIRELNVAKDANAENQKILKANQERLGGEGIRSFGQDVGESVIGTQTTRRIQDAISAQTGFIDNGRLLQDQIEKNQAAARGFDTSLKLLYAQLNDNAQITEYSVDLTEQNTDATEKAAQAQQRLNEQLEETVDIRQQINDLEQNQLQVQAEQIRELAEEEINQAVQTARNQGILDQKRIKEIDELLKTEKELRLRAAQDQRDFDFMQAEESITNQQALQVRLEAIQQEFEARKREIAREDVAFREEIGDELISGQVEYENKFLDGNKALTEEIRNEEQARFDIQKQFIELTTDLFTKNIDERISKINEQIKASEKQFDFLKQKAAEGNIVAEESLAAEQQRIAQANAEKERLERRKQNILLVSTILQSYNANLEAGDDSGTAFAKAVTSTELIKQFVAALPGFFEGTEDTGANGFAYDEHGVITGFTHANERVIKASDNKKLSGYTNTDIVSAVERDRLGGYASTMGNVADNLAVVSELMSLKDEMKAVKNEIKNKEVPFFEFNKVAKNLFESVEGIKKGHTTTRNISKWRSK